MDERFSFFLKKLFANRRLVWEFTRRELSQRHAGQVLGVLWTVGHPLLLMGVYVAVFNLLFRFKLEEGTGTGLDFTTYILSGLIPWMAMQEVLLKSPSTVAASANLAKQAVFPLEVLPLKEVLAALATQMVSLAVLIGYVLIRFGALPWTVALLPVLLLIQAVLLAGIAYLLAAVGVFFKDLREIAQVFCTANFYLMPVLYFPEWLPGWAATILRCNPLTYYVQLFQDILFYGEIRHPFLLAGMAVAAILIFRLGASVFLRLKKLFANVL